MVESDVKDFSCGSASLTWERCRLVGLAGAGMERGGEVSALLLHAGEASGGMIFSEGDLGSGRISRGSRFLWMGIRARNRIWGGETLAKGYYLSELSWDYAGA